jgi:hypothetical protein
VLVELVLVTDLVEWVPVGLAPVELVPVPVLQGSRQDWNMKRSNLLSTTHQCHRWDSYHMCWHLPMHSNNN